MISRASSRSGRHRFHVPGPKFPLTRALRVWVWLPQITLELFTAIIASGQSVAASRIVARIRHYAKVALTSLRGLLPTRTDAANLARRIHTVKTTLTDPQLPQRAATAVRNGLSVAKDAAPTRADTITFARRTAAVGRTTMATLTDPQTPRRVIDSSQHAAQTGMRMARSAVKDPRGAYHAVTEHLSNSTAALTAHSKAGIRNSMALLGAAAIVSLALTGFSPNEADPESQFTVATGTTTDQRAERSGGQRGDDPAPNQPQNEADAPADEAPQQDSSEDEKEKNSDDSDDQKETESKKTTINVDAKPVKGLDKAQMANALAVVQVGEEMNVPKRGQAIALMTVMQETKFYNLASDKYPSSLKLDNEGVGSDHDSVGIFQQRPSMGWGSVKECMDVEYASKAFYAKLLKVDDWQDMKLTKAAQAVQGSAFPNAYAQWDDLAYALLDEFHK